MKSSCSLVAVLTLGVLGLILDPARAEEISRVVRDIGPWTIKRYSDDTLAHIIGAPCAAVQYASGSELMLTVDPDQPRNKASVQLFVSFAKPHQRARIWVDDGMRFDHYLTTYQPQRSGHTGVFSVSEMQGRKLFARFELGHLDMGAFEFSLADLRAVSAVLHQKQCIFDDDGPASPALTRKQAESVSVGDTYESLTQKFGIPSTVYTFTEDNTEGAEWPVGRSDVVIVVFDREKRVSKKVIRPKQPN